MRIQHAALVHLLLGFGRLKSQLAVLDLAAGVYSMLLVQKDAMVVAPINLFEGVDEFASGAGCARDRLSEEVHPG